MSIAQWFIVLDVVRGQSRVGDEGYFCRNLGADLPTRRRVVAVLEEIGVSLAETALSPKVEATSRHGASRAARHGLSAHRQKPPALRRIGKPRRRPRARAAAKNPWLARRPAGISSQEPMRSRVW